ARCGILSRPMSDIATIEIPDRPLFKATEVCELLKVQPYVLRTWEAEFPELGIAKTAGAARVYRRGDVEQVMRIRHLLLVEGLTLAGARRKIDEDADVAAPELVASAAVRRPIVRERIGQNVREHLTSVKRGLRSLLKLLDAPAATRAHVTAPTNDFELAPPTSSTSAPPRAGPRTARSAKSGSAASEPPPSPRRKRSA
ncbi:MAG: MerR family transcriptional regulator, partial [Acidobacteriota bacterium]